MDEKLYRNTYSSINPQRCVFEKAINSRVCNCAKGQRFNLADREGVACKSAKALKRCTQLSNSLHTNARFVLKRINVEQLGHAQEIKIQNGGLIGLQAEVLNTDDQKVDDIDSVISDAEKQYGDVEKFPYSQIMQIISTYRIRARKSNRKNK